MQGNPLAEGLRCAGVTLTAQRLAICNWLFNSDSHPTAAEVYVALQDDFPTMSLATVYNTLGLLENLDLIYEVGIDAEGRKRYDADTQPHINLICRRCGAVIDMADDDLLKRTRRAVAQLDFEPRDITVVVHGLCGMCRLDAGGNNAAAHR